MLKRCEKCGAEADVRRGVRRCGRPGIGRAGLPTGYACYGRLLAVRPKPKVRRPKPALRPQDAAAADLARVRTRLAGRARALATLARDVGRLLREADRLARRAAMTDADVEALRARGKAAAEARRARTRRRAIDVRGTL